ncbi:MAG: TetR/AcrR family transcriptional regulator [Oscillibacter sp.]|jgi:AcrR family transcriptional regulator|nr:TetR/AcrR family transcriptional regulator [Oscillibacter sp.]
MKDTRENILLVALHLFAQNGYEAVSVSEIAGELGITKGALYKHYQSKRDIFDQIVARMEQLDGERARAFQLPEGTLSDMADAYRAASMEQMIAFCRAQFRYWTEEDFPASFRRMLTLEQYRSEEMAALYQQYLVSGPLDYVTDLFRSWNVQNPQKKALELYAPMFLFYGIYDGAADKSTATDVFNAHLDGLCAAWEREG